MDNIRSIGRNIGEKAFGSLVGLTVIYAVLNGLQWLANL